MNELREGERAGRGEEEEARESGRKKGFVGDGTARRRDLRSHKVDRPYRSVIKKSIHPPIPVFPPKRASKIQSDRSSNKKSSQRRHPSRSHAFFAVL